MDLSELETLLADRESDRIERKESLSDTRAIRQVICAFANDLPGHGRPAVLIVGQQDDGRCAHLDISDKLLVKLADIQRDGTILPMPVTTVQRHRLANCEVAVVAVQPLAAPPARYDGRVFVRVGSSTRVASPEEERLLAERRRSRDLPFDLQPVSSANLEDLNLDLLSQLYLPSAVAEDVLAENRRAVSEQLSSLRFANTEAPPTPTVLGVLALGKDPRQFIPGDYVQFLRVAGTTLTDPIKDHKEVAGSLPELLRKLDEILEVHISVASDFTSGPREVEQPDYPVVALQQLVRNAVMHRNYEGTNSPVRITWFDNRIEIQNPGGPFGQVSRDNFGRPGLTDYRNPHLAEAMKYLGYVQRFGVGIPTARSELEKNGNPRLEFDVQATHVLARVRRRP